MKLLEPHRVELPVDTLLIAHEEGISTLDTDYASTWHGCTQSAHIITQCVEEEWDVDIAGSTHASTGVVEHATGRYAYLLGQRAEVWRDPDENVLDVVLLPLD